MGAALAPFYPAVMPVIKPLYTQPSEAAERLGDSTERSSYRSTALECITCVGAAAEVPQYRQDARDVLEVMYREGMGEVEESSEMKNAMMSVGKRRNCEVGVGTDVLGAEGGFPAVRGHDRPDPAENRETGGGNPRGTRRLPRRIRRRCVRVAGG